MASTETYKLFVGSLPTDASHEDLQHVFSTYGNPTDIHIMTGKSNSGQSCAFVVYDRFESAESAIASLDGVYSLREGEPAIRVSWARNASSPAGGYGAAGKGAPRVVQQPVTAAVRPNGVQPIGYPALHQGGGLPTPPPPPQKTKIFIGNLPHDISNEAMTVVFNTYGVVKNCHIMTGKAKSGQACAFIEYSTPVEAETAILTLHEKYEIRPGEGPIIVKYANSQGGRPGPY